MNKPIEEAIDNLIKVVKENSTENTTTFELFINSKTIEIKWGQTTPKSLTDNGWSMKNIKGEWIK